MSSKVMELNELFAQNDMAAKIANQWTKYNDQRQSKIEDWQEARNYIFATDTTSTTNSNLPWKNTTTLPKLCQIRDNLHANYVSALFPTEEWLKWEGYTPDAAVKAKADAIEAYMANKCRHPDFRNTMSQLIYDYIDYGNAFMMSSYESNYKQTEEGDFIPQFIGPTVIRISPLDIVFNPTATSFQNTFKIIRSIKTMGELLKMAEDEPDNSYLREALERRRDIMGKVGGYTTEDHTKFKAYSVDGFGNLMEYYTSGYVEILEFYGDMYDEDKNELSTNRIITVIDRCSVIRDVANPSWLGDDGIYHVGWRKRPDNLWAMGPLDNLIGLQYRIDHLENIKADAMDLAILPPLLIQGEVEEFTWGPGAEIHIAEGGAVTELGRNAQWVITANNDIAQLEQKMERYVGAPSEAMGIRTAGEKTAFEVQQLQNAAGRIFQEKIDAFEISGLQPLLNAMLEISRRYLNSSDSIRVMNDELGIQVIKSVTKEDITASGKLRPVGARHYAQQAQLLSNLQMLSSTALWQTIQPDLSRKALTKMLEDALNIERYGLFSTNAAVFEQQETQRQVNQASEGLEVEQSVNVGGSDEDIPAQ